MKNFISGRLDASYLSHCHDDIMQREVFRHIGDDLSVQGFSVQEGLLPTDLAHTLLNHIQSSNGPDYTPAAIGRAQSKQNDHTIRRDKTAWINADQSPADQAWLQWSDGLRAALNQDCLLGLQPIESHYARYDQGDFYLKHLDAFKSTNSLNRRVSLVCFLNPHWQLEDKGELVLYTGDSNATAITVAPKLGTIAVFLSQEIPHEVLPTKTTRYSIAGWYR